MAHMKMKLFLQALIKSITSPIYYLEILNASFSFSFKFFIAGYLLVSFIATLFFIQFDAPKYRDSIEASAEAVESSFPPLLEIVWNGTLLSSNQTTPITIPYPEGISYRGLPASLSVIAPTIANADQLKALNPNSLVIFGGEKIFVSNSNNDWTSLSLTETPGFEKPFVVNRSNLTEIISYWRSSLTTFLNIMVLIFPVGFFFIMVLSRLVSVCVNSLFIFFLLRLLGKSLAYKKVLQLCFHIAVVAELIRILTSQMTSSAQLNMFDLAFWTYLIIILVSLWNVKSIILMKISEKR